MKAYEILNQLVKNYILRLAFEVYCNKCNKFQNNIYDFLNEIPRFINCRHCEGNINFNKDIIVIYKVNENKEKVFLKYG